MTHEGILLHESPQVGMSHILVRLSMTHEGMILPGSPQVSAIHVLASPDTSVLGRWGRDELQVVCHAFLC